MPRPRQRRARARTARPTAAAPTLDGTRRSPWAGPSRSIRSTPPPQATAMSARSTPTSSTRSSGSRPTSRSPPISPPNGSSRRTEDLHLHPAPRRDLPRRHPVRRRRRGRQHRLHHRQEHPIQDLAQPARPLRVGQGRRQIHGAVHLHAALRAAPGATRRALSRHQSPKALKEYGKDLGMHPPAPAPSAS